ncbi:uncharacterized protein BN610_01519 [Acidaminococcus intestini CAG:325]|nr:uncharacterized protein BN610_01519 [Acidaminococcus intestini CAG:325]
MRTQGTGRYVEDAREHFAGNLIHVRDHEEQPLGSRVGCRQGAGLQGTVNSTGSTAFGLHFNNVDRLTEEVLFTVGRPFIDMFRHRG